MIVSLDLGLGEACSPASKKETFRANECSSWARARFLEEGQLVTAQALNPSRSWAVADGTLVPRRRLSERLSAKDILDCADVLVCASVPQSENGKMAEILAMASVAATTISVKPMPA